MIDKFKDFFRKKQTKVPEVPKSSIDPDYLINFTNDIITSLGDLKDVYIEDKIILKKPESFIEYKVKLGKRTIETPKYFIIKYKVKLGNNVDLNELKLEILNCKSHLQSEDLVLNLKGKKHIIVSLKDNKETTACLDLDLDNLDKDGPILIFDQTNLSEIGLNSTKLINVYRSKKIQESFLILVKIEL
jgi:hypothetical protein